MLPVLILTLIIGLMDAGKIIRTCSSQSVTKQKDRKSREIGEGWKTLITFFNHVLY